MGRVDRAARAEGADRRGRRPDQRLPPRARANRLWVQRIRGRTRRLPRPAGRARDPVVLEVGRGPHHALARAGIRLRGPATHPRGDQPM